MSILRIGYKSENAIETIIDLLDVYVITWDVVRQLIQEIDWSSVKNIKTHPMYEVEKEYNQVMDSIASISGNYEIDSVTYRCRFAFFATRITHLWYDPVKSNEGRCLHPSGQICAYIGANEPVSYIWINVGEETGMPSIVGCNVDNIHVPLRLAIRRNYVDRPMKLSLDLRQGKTFHSIRGDFMDMCIFRDSATQLYTNIYFDHGILARHFMCIVTRGRDYEYVGAWYNNGKNGQVTSFPVSMHPLEVEQS